MPYAINGFLGLAIGFAFLTIDQQQNLGGRVAVRGVAHPIAREGRYVHFKTFAHARWAVEKIPSASFVMAFEFGFVQLSKSEPPAVLPRSMSSGATELS